MSTPFSFQGPLPPSKSLLIRHLLLTLYEPRITLLATSQCSDVLAMQRACAAFRTADPAGQNVIDCGEAGLILRLLLSYAARRGGDFLLTGSPRLLERPHTPLVLALRQLGVQVEPVAGAHGAALRVQSSGWQRPQGPLRLLGGLSSQFASSLLLNAWGLPFPLSIECDSEPVSEGYLQMSIDVARRFGMAVAEKRDAARMLLEVSAEQAIRPGAGAAEADVSSAFAVAAIAAVAGRALISNFPEKSLQPDHCFVELLRRMGAKVLLSEKGLVVEKADKLMAIEANLSGAPDLFPVLAVLCSLAGGRSLLFAAPQLRAKESDRVATTAALLSALHRQHVPRDDGMEIWGQPLQEAERSRAVSFDATGDHRLVMAAAVARWAGFPIAIRGLSAVHKSFPELLSIAQLSSEAKAPSA